MAIARFGRQVKRSYHSYGFCVKLSAAVILGMCFIFVWSAFSNYSVTSQRDTFDDIAEATSASKSKVSDSQLHSDNSGNKNGQESGNKQSSEPGFEEKGKSSVNGSASVKPEKHRGKLDSKGMKKSDEKEKNEENEKSDADEAQRENEKDETNDKEGENEDNEGNEADVDLVDDGVALDQEAMEEEEDKEDSGNESRRKKKNLGPLFDPKARYTWKLCSTRSKHNYIPCIDVESGFTRFQGYRHHERSCPKSAVMCLVPLPREGYDPLVHWPESMVKILYKNVAHPKLTSFVKTQDWVVESGGYLTFPQNQSARKAGVQHYLESIEEMVPDIEWGKNIRVVLDMGCKDSSFAAALLDKNVITLTLGLKDDLIDLAQVALERGFPAVVSPFANRRLPFPSGVFDSIHCGDCDVSWHSNGGKLILEMNRVLRPGGYFIISAKHSSIETEEAMSKLASSICWNILADKSDEVSDVGIKIYQKPLANDIYELRRKKIPPLCKENENPDFAWYVPLKACVHKIPEDIEQHGTEWPAEWPNRLYAFPEWTNSREKLSAESERWKSVVNNSYLSGMGIDWSNIRNVMDMKAIGGGFAAALSSYKNVWVMNVVTVHSPDTLPLIFERGLIGIYHDWCESFGSYPRSYDLLHADHLFSRLKNRCKQPLVIVVEMDRLLRPGGWAIIRDKVVTLNSLEDILRSLHWEIRMTFAQGREGILCAQKTKWRP